MVPYFTLLLVFFVGGFALPVSKNEDSTLVNDMSIFFDHTNTNNRIVGGSTAGEGTYPWMAAIAAGSWSNIFICGSALITNRHAITAAHCVSAFLSSGHTSSGRVIVGSNNWDDGGTRYYFRTIAIIPDYDAVNKKNDIGMVVTSREITFSDRVTSIPISYDSITGGLLVRVSGWGWREVGGSLPDQLQEIRMMTLDGESCAVEVRRVAQSLGMHVPRVDPAVEICTFLTGNEGICIGDGGSPLVLNSNNHLVGVASWGVPCARGAPDVFTRISVYRTWIDLVLSLTI